MTVVVMSARYGEANARRKVDARRLTEGMGWLLATKHPQNVIGDVLGHQPERFLTGTGDVGSHHDVFQAEQRMIGRRRLLDEYVQTRAGKPPGLERREQCVLVDQTA